MKGCIKLKLKVNNTKETNKVNESWDESRNLHSKLSSAYSDAKRLADSDNQYSAAANLILVADAYLAAIDSIDDNEDELRKADDLSDFVRDTSSMTSAVNRSYDKILKYIDGQKPSGRITESDHFKSPK